MNSAAALCTLLGQTARPVEKISVLCGRAGAFQQLALSPVRQLWLFQFIGTSDDGANVVPLVQDYAREIRLGCKLNHHRKRAT